MEKIMFFGLAIWFGVMMSVSPKPVHMPPRPVPVTGANDIEMTTPIEPQAVYDNTKPVKVDVEAIYWHSPE